MAQALGPSCALLEEAARQTSAVQTRLDVANRRLLAAQDEIKRCQSRILACERTISALQTENAELRQKCAALSAAAPAKPAAPAQAADAAETRARQPATPVPAMPQELAEPDAGSAPEHKCAERTEAQRLAARLISWFDNCLAGCREE